MCRLFSFHNGSFTCMATNPNTTWNLTQSVLAFDLEQQCFIVLRLHDLCIEKCIKTNLVEYTNVLHTFFHRRHLWRFLYYTLLNRNIKFLTKRKWSMWLNPLRSFWECYTNIRMAETCHRLSSHFIPAQNTISGQQHLVSYGEKTQIWIKITQKDSFTLTFEPEILES